MRGTTRKHRAASMECRTKQQEVEDRIAWMKRMDAVEAEAAERDAKAAKEFETADLANWHPPYEPVE